MPIKTATISTSAIASLDNTAKLWRNAFNPLQAIVPGH